jgi:hypothetical protein
MSPSSRTQWPAAGRLQAAADAARAEIDPRWHVVADHLDVVANNLAWLAPFHDHEPGSPMWDSANALADTILGEAS